jgi:hypothetical protein
MMRRAGTKATWCPDLGDGTDRTTRKLSTIRRTQDEVAQMRSWKAKKQRRDALPKRIHELRKGRDALRKEAKDLERAK